MSNIVPTLTVKHAEFGIMVINADDFDPAIHQVDTGSEEAPVKFDREVAFEYLKTQGIEVPKNMNTEKLKALVAETEAAVAAAATQAPAV